MMSNERNGSTSSYNQFSLGLENLTLNVNARTNGSSARGNGYLMDGADTLNNISANAAHNNGDFFFNQPTKPLGFWNN